MQSSSAALKIELARRAYVAAIGTKAEQAKRAELERLVYEAKKAAL